MKSFDTIVENTKAKTNLIRIRLKVDPKIREGIDFRQYDGYEGYILEESNKKCRVLLDNCSAQIIEIPFDFVEVEDVLNQEQLEKVKEHAIQYLQLKNKLNQPLSEQILQATNLEFLEQYLKGAGLGDDDVKKIYRNALFNIVKEGLGETIQNTASNIWNHPATKLAKNAFIPGYLANKTLAPMIDKATRGMQPGIVGGNDFQVNKNLTPDQKKAVTEWISSLSGNEKTYGPIIVYNIAVDETQISVINSIIKHSPNVLRSINPRVSEEDFINAYNKYSITGISAAHINMEIDDQKFGKVWDKRGVTNWFCSVSIPETGFYSEIDLVNRTATNFQSIARNANFRASNKNTDLVNTLRTSARNSGGRIAYSIVFRIPKKSTKFVRPQGI